MRQFTEAENQQPHTKVDNRKLHSQTASELGDANNEPLQVESRAKRDGSLEIILLLIALSAILLIWSWNDIGFNSMPLMPLMCALMLLVNHITFCITKPGRMHRLMKTIARVWMLFVGGCLIWALHDLIRLAINGH